MTVGMTIKSAALPRYVMKYGYDENGNKLEVNTTIIKQRSRVCARETVMQILFQEQDTNSHLNVLFQNMMPG
jgi:hypothetical protein